MLEKVDQTGQTTGAPFVSGRTPNQTGIAFAHLERRIVRYSMPLERRPQSR